jgi:ribonuclease G
MSKELVIGCNRHETKVAILEDDQLAEIYFQRENEYSLAGSIHKGRVTRVLPGMQSAFVDLGLERDTFLYVSDFFEEHEDIDTVNDEKQNRSERRDRGQQVRLPERTQPVVQNTDAATGAQPAAFSKPPIEEAAAPAAVSAGSAESSEQRQSERTENDRNFRGDRRGRRSRRRRSRGRGFPENKYAQPGVPEPTASEPRSVSLAPSESEEERDVIILPGESLAKYRNVMAPSGEAPDTGDLESEAERDEELDEEVQEIESVDRIFSHHPGETDVDEEEKLEEVQEDQPSSPFLVEDEVSDEVEPESPAVEEEERSNGSAEVRSSSAIEPLQSSSLYSLDEQKPATAAPTLTVRERFDEPVAYEESSTVVSDEGIETEEPEIADVDVPGPSGAGGGLEPLDVADFEGVDLEDVRGDIDVEAPEFAEPAPAESSTLVQPLDSPEAGNRFLHRGSRRMRRRRGGHRSSQQFGEGATAQSAGVPGTGAAAALQPDTAPPEAQRDVPEERSAERPERVMPSITELLKPGQEIIVQIAKEPLGQKGARITSHVALPGRYVVFMPSVSHLGVSRKIESDEERQRLKRILQTHRVGSGGFIVRTAGEGIPEEEIAADMDFLYKLWLDIRQKAEKRPAPALLHYDLDIVQRILRDQVTEDFKAIWVDSEEMYENVLSFTQRFQPALVNRVKMYTRSAPIFDAFGITQELEKALRPKVWLKSGGYIVINQTEALVAIDINTGKYVGKSNRLEDTIVKTNTEAVKEIVRQIRLRDLGGIIVVDFIDMDERKNRQKVMQALEETMQADRAPYKILQFNDFGLVAITRKRVKQSLERTLCAPCPYCEAAGYVKSVQTIIGEILVEGQKIAKAIEGKDVLLRVHTDVAKVLKSSDNHYLEELEEILGRPVLVKGDPALHHEKFDLG